MRASKNALNFDPYFHTFSLASTNMLVLVLTFNQKTSALKFFEFFVEFGKI